MMRHPSGGGFTRFHEHGGLHMILRAFVILVAALVFVPWQAQAQVIGANLGVRPPERIVAIDGDCYIVSAGFDGRERRHRCDEDDFLDEFSDAKWDNFCREFGHLLSEQQYQRYCGPIDVYDYTTWELPIVDGVTLSKVEVALNGHYDLSAPYLQGYLATEDPPGTLVNPAFTRELSYSGGGFRLDFDAQVGLRGMAPIDFTGGMDFTSTTANASAQNLPFVNGLGITGVGATPGVFINSPTDVLTFDLSSVRNSIALRKMFGIPIFSGEYSFRETAPPAEYVVLARVGFNGGLINQTDTARYTTSTPAFGVNAGSTIAYDTTFTDRLFGGKVGLGFESTMPLGTTGGSNQPLRLSKSAGVTLGYDQHYVSVRDSVDAQGLGGALNYQSTKDLTYTLGIPTVSLDAKVGIGSGRWEASLGGGISLGENPGYEYSRPDSVGGVAADPVLKLNWGVSYRAQASFSVGF